MLSQLPRTQAHRCPYYLYKVVSHNRDLKTARPQIASFFFLHSERRMMAAATTKLTCCIRAYLPFDCDGMSSHMAWHSLVVDIVELLQPLWLHHCCRRNHHSSCHVPSLWLLQLCGVSWTIAGLSLDLSMVSTEGKMNLYNVLPKQYSCWLAQW